MQRWSDAIGQLTTAKEKLKFMNNDGVRRVRDMIDTNSIFRWLLPLASKGPLVKVDAIGNYPGFMSQLQDDLELDMLRLYRCREQRGTKKYGNLLIYSKDEDLLGYYHLHIEHEVFNANTAVEKLHQCAEAMLVILSQEWPCGIEVPFPPEAKVTLRNLLRCDGLEA